MSYQNRGVVGMLKDWADALSPFGCLRPEQGILCHGSGSTQDYVPPGEVLYNFWDRDTPAPRHKREPVTAITLAMLFTLGAAGTGTGIASLTTQH